MSAIKTSAVKAENAIVGINCYTNQISAIDRDRAIAALQELAQVSVEQEKQYQATIKTLENEVEKKKLAIRERNARIKELEEVNAGLRADKGFDVDEITRLYEENERIQNQLVLFREKANEKVESTRRSLLEAFESLNVDA